MANKVLLATSDVTVHKLQGEWNGQFGPVENVEAVVLRPGDTIELDALASYQREAAENGDLFGVELVSEKEAQKRQADYAALQDAATAGVPLAFQTVTFAGDDGSFSDHLVSDDERVANHAARADEEAGEAGTDDKVTVAGAESETSPATSGRKTRSRKVSDEVQGSGGEEAADTSGEGDAPEGADDPKTQE